MKLTKAMYARQVSAIVRRATLEAGELAEGMWNPLFCSDDAAEMARRFSEEIQRHLDGLQGYGDGQSPDTEAR